MLHKAVARVTRNAIAREVSATSIRRMTILTGARCTTRTLPSTMNGLSSNVSRETISGFIQTMPTYTVMRTVTHLAPQIEVTDSPDEVVKKMIAQKQHRAYLIYDPNTARIETSHPMFDTVARALQANTRDFDKHEAIFLAIGPETKVLFAAFLHNTVRGPGAGGTRCWDYPTFDDLLKDGLRLSQGMGRKNSLAGLHWGGGKAIVASGPRSYLEHRQRTFEEFGSFITSLQGCYITAKDMGVTKTDMATIFSRTRFSTCIPTEFGGSGDPSYRTGVGVVCGMEAAVDWARSVGQFPKPAAADADPRDSPIKGLRVAVMGAGKVAASAISTMVNKGVKSIIVSETNLETLEEMKQFYHESPVPVTFRQVSPTDVSILAEDVDIVSPCAVGGILNPLTIPSITAKFVVGGANNQLLDSSRDGALLSRRGTIYVPDFLCNRMGIVNCANEDAGNMINDPAIMRHLDKEYPEGVYQKTLQVLNRSVKEGITSNEAAEAIADEMMKSSHPIWPGRSQHIIRSLVQHAWAAN